MKKSVKILIICFILGGLYYIGKNKETTDNSNSENNQIIESKVEEAEKVEKVDYYIVEEYEPIDFSKVSFNNYDDVKNHYEQVLKVIFNIDYKYDLENYIQEYLNNNVFDYINYEEVLLNKYAYTSYEEKYNGNIDLIYDEIRGLNIDFLKEGLRYKSIGNENLSITPNIELCIEEGKTKTLEGTYLVFNEKPIIIERYNKETNQVINTFEYTVPMLLDSKGKVKALCIYEEKDRAVAKEDFFRENGLGDLLINERPLYYFDTMEEIEQSNEDYNSEDATVHDYQEIVE